MLVINLSRFTTFATVEKNPGKMSSSHLSYRNVLLRFALQLLWTSWKKGWDLIAWFRWKINLIKENVECISNHKRTHSESRIQPQFNFNPHEICSLCAVALNFFDLISLGDKEKPLYYFTHEFMHAYNFIPQAWSSVHHEQNSLVCLLHFKNYFLVRFRLLVS